MKNGDDKWRAKLSDDQFRIMRQGGTEAPFTGDLLHNKDTGVYACAACGSQLFHSDNKFDSGSGWPSFDDVMKSTAVTLLPDDGLGMPGSEPSRPSRPSGREARSADGGKREDLLLGMNRIEVRCANCDSHLGHVFDDGPSRTTGKRYCINSVCLNFTPEKD